MMPGNLQFDAPTLYKAWILYRQQVGKRAEAGRKTVKKGLL
ncbi:MAG: hypothetical protein R3294_16285 [Arenibacter troitsensis]|nr:hypothetical protein [Arenibacter troitsensis]